MKVLHVMSFVIERMKFSVRPFAADLMAYLPQLWQESAQHNLLRCTILTTLTNLAMVVCWLKLNIQLYSLSIFVCRAWEGFRLKCTPFSCPLFSWARTSRKRRTCTCAKTVCCCGRWHCSWRLLRRKSCWICIPTCQLCLVCGQLPRKRIFIILLSHFFNHVNFTSFRFSRRVVRSLFKNHRILCDTCASRVFSGQFSSTFPVWNQDYIYLSYFQQHGASLNESLRSLLTDLKSEGEAQVYSVSEYRMPKSCGSSCVTLWFPFSDR